MKAGRDTLQFIFELAACETRSTFDAVHQEHLKMIRLKLLDSMIRKGLIEETTRILRKFYSEAPDVSHAVGFCIEHAVQQDATALARGLDDFKQRSFKNVPPARLAVRRRTHLRYG